jgi:hypothetical protein
MWCTWHLVLLFLLITEYSVSSTNPDNENDLCIIHVHPAIPQDQSHSSCYLCIAWRLNENVSLWNTLSLCVSLLAKNNISKVHYLVRNILSVECADNTRITFVSLSYLIVLFYGALSWNSLQSCRSWFCYCWMELRVGWDRYYRDNIPSDSASSLWNMQCQWMVSSMIVFLSGRADMFIIVVVVVGSSMMMFVPHICRDYIVQIPSNTHSHREIVQYQWIYTAYYLWHEAPITLGPWVKRLWRGCYFSHRSN